VEELVLVSGNEGEGGGWMVDLKVVKRGNGKGCLWSL